MDNPHSALLWEMALRGAVAGVLLFHLLALTWFADTRVRRALRFPLAAFVTNLLAYLLCSAPPELNPLAMSPPALMPFGGTLGLFLLALCMAGLPFLWLSLRALFDDGFEISALLFWLPAGVAALGLVGHSGVVDGFATPAVRLGARQLFGLLQVVLVAALLWEVARGWRDDLVEPRRRARRWVALGLGVYAGVVVVLEWTLKDVPIGRALPSLHVAGMGGVALLLAGLSARYGLGELLGMEQLQAGHPAIPPAAILAEPTQPASATLAAPPKLQGLLTAAMQTDHLYRQEGLSLATLAQKLNTTDANLRALINQRLGFRNFNDFLHHHRLAEASQRLVAEELPILSIALGCGYGSIGPFNRAFKQRFGATPSEFRVAGKLKAGQIPTAKVAS